MFGIADDILVVGYDSDGKDHDETLQQVLQICRHMSLKLNIKNTPMTQRSNFLLNRTKFILVHKLLPGLLPRLHQVCGKMFFFTTDGIVVENVVLLKLISFYFYFILFYSILFYSIFNFVMLSFKMLGVIISLRS